MTEANDVPTLVDEELETVETPDPSMDEESETVEPSNGATDEGDDESTSSTEEAPASRLHLITGHKKEPHVSSDDAGKFMSLIIGDGRYIMEGFNVRISSATTVVVEAGCILADGRFIRLSSPEVVELENGQIGRNRIDQLRIRYECYATGVERASFVVVTGTPSSGAASVPLNEHNGNILERDRIVDIPLCNLPRSGLTLGTPVMLLPMWVWPPSNTDMNAYIAEISKLVSDASLANAAAWETVRANEAVLADISQKQDEWAKKMVRLDEFEAELSDFAQILVNQMDNYIILGSTLYVPSSWIDYDPEAHTASFKYTEQDGTSLSFTKAPTVATRQAATQEQTDVNTADIDFLLMMSEVG